MEQIIEVYERYLTNSDEEIQLYEDIGLPLPADYDYRRLRIRIEDIMDVKQETERESKIIFFGGYEIIVFGNADEIFIRINDLKNNEIEDEG